MAEGPGPKTGKPLTTVKTAFVATCRRAGIAGLRFHDLRHAFRSRLFEKGADIETVRSLLGHASIAVTQRYVHSTHERRRIALSAGENPRSIESAVLDLRRAIQPAALLEEVP